MIGFLLAIWKNLEWLGWAIVESFIVKWFFNYFAPILITTYGVPLPFDRLPYWHIFAGFILLYYIGKIIKTLSPFYIKINNNSEQNKSA